MNAEREERRASKHDSGGEEPQQQDKDGSGATGKEVGMEKALVPYKPQPQTQQQVGSGRTRNRKGVKGPILLYVPSPPLPT